jgi:hypothetical protein
MKQEFQAGGDPDPDPADVASAAFSSLANETRSLDLLNRYESRYDRQYFRSHRRLLDLQDRRMRNEPDNTPPPGLGPVLVNPASGKDASEKTNSAKGTQADAGSDENAAPAAPRARLPHWLDSFTPYENIANPRPLQLLPPESLKKPAVMSVASGIEQS